MIDNMISAFLNGILERIQIVVLCFVLYFFLFLYSLCCSCAYIALFCWVCAPRDYNQDLEAILLSKPTRFTVEKLAMWQDYIGRTLAQGAPACTSGDTPAEIEDAED